MYAKGTIIFSQPPNWDLTADVTTGSWKGTKMKIGSDKEVLVFQSHRRERDLFEGLAGNFLKMKRRDTPLHSVLLLDYILFSDLLRLL